VVDNCKRIFTVRGLLASSLGVGHIYNRYSYSREKQQALEAWKRKLNGIVIDTKNIVVSISSHKNKA